MPIVDKNATGWTFRPLWTHASQEKSLYTLVFTASPIWPIFVLTRLQITWRRRFGRCSSATTKVYIWLWRVLYISPFTATVLFPGQKCLTLTKKGIYIRREAKDIWTSAGSLLNGLSITNFSEILIKTHIFSCKKMRFKTLMVMSKKHCWRTWVTAVLLYLSPYHTPTYRALGYILLQTVTNQTHR